MVDQQQDSSKNRNQHENPQPSEMSNDREDDFAFESASPQPKQVMVTDEELRNLQKEILDYKDKYLRLLADAENARKRLQKERQEMTKYAIENLIVDFLRPIDNFENALRFAEEMSDEVKNWAFGFQMILAQFKDVLAQNGISSIDSLGKPFNPHDHEAVEMVESTESPPNTIIEECMRGYKMGDRTIRAARVKVAKTKEKSKSSQEQDSNENI
jgi:molecular chaperone GrpE